MFNLFPKKKYLLTKKDILCSMYNEAIQSLVKGEVIIDYLEGRDPNEIVQVNGDVQYDEEKKMDLPCDLTADRSLEKSRAEYIKLDQKFEIVQRLLKEQEIEY